MILFRVLPNYTSKTNQNKHKNKYEINTSNLSFIREHNCKILNIQIGDLPYYIRYGIISTLCNLTWLKKAY